MVGVGWWGVGGVGGSEGGRKGGGEDKLYLRYRLHSDGQRCEPLLTFH